MTLKKWVQVWWLQRHPPPIGTKSESPHPPPPRGFKQSELKIYMYLIFDHLNLL